MTLNEISPETIKNTLKTFANINTLRELKGITHDEMEAVYSVGLSYYKTGSFEQAEKLFRFLCLFDHVNSKFWTALGGVYQATRRYVEAVQSYQYALFLDCHNVRVYGYLIKCHLALGQEDGAIDALTMFETVGARDAAEQAYLEKAQALCANLQPKAAKKGA